MTSRRLIHLLSALVAATALGCATGSRESLDAASTPALFETVAVRSQPPDPAMAELIAPYRAKVDEWRRPIGRSAEVMAHVRLESPLTVWVTDSARAETAAKTGRPIDLLMLNGGGIRTSLPAGEVTYFDLSQILPFENTMVIAELTGTQLVPIFEQIASQKGRVIISGGTLMADAEGKLLGVTIDGEPLDPSRVYRFGTVDFLANGGGGFEVLRGLPFEDTRLILRDVVADHIRKNGEAGTIITPPAEYSRQLYGGLRVEELPK